MERQEDKANHVPDGWQVVRLADVAEVVGGSTPSRANGAFWGGSIPWVVPSELTELSGRYLTDTRESITQVGMDSAGLRSIPVGSVLLTSRATIGVTAINTMPLVTNQGFQNLVVKNGADALWLYYCVSNRRGELQRRAAGSTFREVSRDSVRSLPILLPPLSEQRAIADVLDAINEAIERTEAVIDATERLRGALLHDLLTRGVPGWHSEWREVPGLGTVPTAWDVVRLGERAKILSGAAFSSAYFSSNEGLPLIRNRDINSSDTELRYFGPYDDKYLVHPGDLLVRMDGDFQAAKWKGRLALLNQRVARVSVSESALDASILYYAHPQALGSDPAPNDRDDGQASVGGADRCHPDPRRVRARAASHRRHARQRRRHYRASGRGAACITIIEGVGVGRAVVGARPRILRSVGNMAKFYHIEITPKIPSRLTNLGSMNSIFHLRSLSNASSPRTARPAR